MTVRDRSRIANDPERPHLVFGVRRATDNAEEDRKAFRAYVEGVGRGTSVKAGGATDGRAPSRETRPGKG